jgi:hypothetical protein
MTATRRFYLYLITLAALGVLAGGIGQLLALLFDQTIKAAPQVGRGSFSAQQLSLGLAMTVIGGPLWFFFWRSIEGRTAGNVEEIGSAIRKLYLNLVLVAGAMSMFIAGQSVLKWLISGALRTQFESGTLATAIVAGLIWFFHLRVSEKEGHPSPRARTLRRWYMYILSAFGLVWLMVSIVELVSSAALALPVWGQTLVRVNFWNGSVQSIISRIVTGGLVWYIHWFRIAKGDLDSVLRQVYFYLLTVSGGVIAALVALTVTVQKFITWALGGVQGAVGQHFQFLGWAIPTVLVGAAVWSYHSRLATEEGAQIEGHRQSAERVHLYLMSFIGLGTMSAGLIVLFAILLNWLISVPGKPLTPGTGWWQSLLGLCLALLVVGTPVWLYFWGRVLKRSERGIDEWQATSRRIFLYAIVVITIGTLIADFVNIVYQMINGMLQGHANTIMRELRWSLQTAIVAAPMLWYHLRIIRTDQKRGGEAVAKRRQVVLITADTTGAVASKLEAKLGYRVQVWRRVGATGEPADLSEDELTRLADEIAAAPTSNVMLVGVTGAFTVVAYLEK